MRKNDTSPPAHTSSHTRPGKRIRQTHARTACGVVLFTAALIGIIALTGTAHAQTAVVEAENDGGETLWQLNDDGGFAVFGEYDAGDGAIPAEGGGARLMWYPEKAAFRAGGLETSQEDTWDDHNVGEYSAAMGRSTTASGFFSTALGRRTTASETGSTAMGRFTTASGFSSTAMGGGTTASGSSSTAIGNSTTASGTSSTAMGESTTATGIGSTAMGSLTTASSNYSTAMGRSTTASGNYSTAMGRNTTASGTSSTAMGQHTTASANYSTAMGGSTTARGPWSSAIGFHTIANNHYSLSAGQYNDANQTGDGTLFVVGNGSNDDNRSDALVLDEDGDLEIAGSLTESSDRRLKTAIQPLDESVLDALSAIRPVRYRFREGTGHPAEAQIGLLAQEVAAQFPELVREGADGYLSLSYAKLTAVLVRGLQEQQGQIDALEAEAERVDALEARLDALERTRGNEQAAGVGFPVAAVWLLGLTLAGGLVFGRRRAMNTARP